MKSAGLGLRKNATNITLVVYDSGDDGAEIERPRVIATKLEAELFAFYLALFDEAGSSEIELFFED